ncbi:MAG: glycine zipper 2TM domain-containing protein [Porticoccaceae bacterium]|jgi:uncharacterized protein YcfJ
MNKSTVTGIVIGVVIASAGAVIGGYNLLDQKPAEPEFAEVLSVKPITETLSTPREVCEEVAITEKAPVKDENQILGTVAGAVIGGVLGNQVGGGSGKKVATVAGAAAGGYAGKKTQEGMQNKNTTTRYETRCETVYDSSQVTKGYDVAYRIGDTEGSVKMDYDPGERIPVKDGELVIGQ